MNERLKKKDETKWKMKKNEKLIVLLYSREARNTKKKSEENMFGK